MRFVIIPVFLMLGLAGCSHEKLNPLSPSTRPSVVPDSGNRTLSPSDILALDTGGLNHYSFIQGNLVRTGNALDMAVSDGKSFFIMKQGDSLYFLRRPARFFVDRDGYVVKDSGGPRLMGYMDSPDLGAVLTDPEFAVAESLLVEIRLPADVSPILRPEPIMLPFYFGIYSGQAFLDSLNRSPVVLAGILMDQSGIIDSVSPDGNTVHLFKIALCRFPTPEGLKLNNDYFARTDLSGDPAYGDGTVFSLKTGSYELSSEE